MTIVKLLYNDMFHMVGYIVMMYHGECWSCLIKKWNSIFYCRQTLYTYFVSPTGRPTKRLFRVDYSMRRWDDAAIHIGIYIFLVSIDVDNGYWKLPVIKYPDQICIYSGWSRNCIGQTFQWDLCMIIPHFYPLWWISIIPDRQVWTQITSRIPPLKSSLMTHSYHP